MQVVRENQIAVRYDYNAYEQLIGEYAEDEGDHNPYRYAGEYRDKETKYIYLRARYYDPEISRFLNVDPIKDGINWYGYTGGNPVRYTDPSGLKRRRGAEIALGGDGKRGKVSPPRENSSELSVKKSQGSITAMLALSASWLPAVDLLLPIGDALYVGIVGVSATIEYGPAVVHTVGTYGPAIIDGMKQGVTSVVERGIEGVNTYGPILRDQAIQATERIFGTGVVVGSDAGAIVGELEDVAGQYGYGECKEAAQAMADILKREKKEYGLASLTMTPADFIASIMYPSKDVSSNGLHWGVIYDGKIYCNIHPTGLPKEMWKNDFYGRYPIQYQEFKTIN